MTHTTSRHHHVREDCWTESETETLIDSWGDRYIQLNRGNLRQKDWKDVSDAVNATRDLLKIPRTDVQCKNRIDTLKKKYKVEKSKTTPSNWPFFTRLGELIGAGNNITRKKVNGSKSVSELGCKAGTSFKGVVDAGGSDEESLDGSNGAMAYKELSRAIVRLGEVYERMENVKQEEMMKLEKERMEFTRELEFQRLNMFVQTRVEIERMKNNNNNKKKKRSSAAGSLSLGKKPQR